jgi:hypothetical protein
MMLLDAGQRKGALISMIRKLLLTALTATLPIAIVVATSGVASAVTVDPSGPFADGGPAGVSCTATGGTMTLKYAVGYGGSWVPPSVNRGNVATFRGIHLSCEPAYSEYWDFPFTGVASGTITITDRSLSPSAFYTCALFDESVPPAGGRLSGLLKVEWTPPAGQAFSAGNTMLRFSSIEGSDAVIGDDTYAQFYIPSPDGPSPTVTGSFPGTDDGHDSSGTFNSSADVAAITSTCASARGLKSIRFGSGGSLQLA